LPGAGLASIFITLGTKGESERGSCRRKPFTRTPKEEGAEHKLSALFGFLFREHRKEIVP
jgi:hypothetical protein